VVKVNLSHHDWYELYLASGKFLPLSGGSFPKRKRVQYQNYYSMIEYKQSPAFRYLKAGPYYCFMNSSGVCSKSHVLSVGAL